MVKTNVGINYSIVFLVFQNMDMHTKLVFLWEILKILQHLGWDEYLTGSPFHTRHRDEYLTGIGNCTAAGYFKGLLWCYIREYGQRGNTGNQEF